LATTGELLNFCGAGHSPLSTRKVLATFLVSRLAGWLVGCLLYWYDYSLIAAVSVICLSPAGCHSPPFTGLPFSFSPPPSPLAWWVRCHFRFLFLPVGLRTESVSEERAVSSEQRATSTHSLLLTASHCFSLLLTAPHCSTLPPCSHPALTLSSPYLHPVCSLTLPALTLLALHPTGCRLQPSRLACARAFHSGFPPQSTAIALVK